jgi:hypothetical protein
MHNLVSFNQLAEWKHLGKDNPEDITKVSDYYSCIIENSEDRQAKKMCKRLLE